MTRGVGRTIQGAALAYASALAIASLLPSGTGSLRGWDSAISPGIQNLLHVPAYAVLFVLASLAAASAGRRGLRTLIWVGLACCAFGAALEAAQAAIPGRMGSPLDALLNVAGVAGGALATLLWRTSFRRTPPGAEAA